MHKLLILCVAFFGLSLTATAQDSIAALDAGGPASQQSGGAPTYESESRPWQLGAGFQYQHFGVLGTSYHNFGFNSSITGYLSDWFGIEGTAAMGFGHTGTAPLNLNLDAKSLFVGGGPHLVVNNRSKFKPWAHALVGLEHFRFTQTNNKIGLGSNSALGFMAGGGVDYQLMEGVYWRIQGDFIGSHVGLMTQKNYSFGSGIVFSF